MNRSSAQWLMVVMVLLPSWHVTNLTMFFSEVRVLVHVCPCLQVSDEVSNWVKGERLWEVSEQLVGLAPSESKEAAAQGASATSA